LFDAKFQELKPHFCGITQVAKGPLDSRVVSSPLLKVVDSLEDSLRIDKTKGNYYSFVSLLFEVF